MIPSICTDPAVPSYRWTGAANVRAMMTCTIEQGHREPDHPWSANRGRGEVPPGGERREACRVHHVRLPRDDAQPAAGGVDRYGAVTQPCPHPRHRSPTAVSARARAIALSITRVGHRRQFRGRNPSRQRRVSRDRRPAPGPRRNRTQSPGLLGPHTVPNRRNLPRFGQISCGVPRNQDLCRQRLEGATPRITPPNRPPPHRASSVPVLPRSSAAPRCQSAASRRSANAAAGRPPPAPSSP